MAVRFPSAAFLLALCCALFPARSSRGQDVSDLKVQKIAGGFQFAGGPVWSPEGFLVFSDIPTGRILHLAPPETEKDLSRLATWRTDSGGANGNAFDAQGRLYTCEGRARRVTRTDKKGKVEVLAERWEGKHFNAPGDIVVRHDGAAYFTDPAFGSAVDARELDFYGVFHITPKGEVSVIAKWRTRPRGLALSPDGRLLYVADADLHSIKAFDLDRAGAASHERSFVTGIKGVPGGLRTDENGNVYAAANSVWIYKPSGTLLAEIPLAETPSNLAFGDEDFRSLYITARTSVYRTNLNVKGSVQY